MGKFYLDVERSMLTLLWVFGSLGELFKLPFLGTKVQHTIFFVLLVNDLLTKDNEKLAKVSETLTKVNEQLTKVNESERK